jgi:AraC-like DNA-binding protein
MPVPHRQVFHTTDRDQAGEYLVKMYGPSARMTGRETGYSFRHTRLDAGAFAIDSSGQTDEIAYTVGPLPTVLIGHPRTMVMDFRSGGVDHRFGPGEVFLASADPDGEPFGAHWGDGEMQAVTVPFPLLSQVAGTGPIRFTDLRPVTPAAARHLSRTIDYVAESLRTVPPLAGTPLVVATAGQSLAAAVLTAFPNTALDEPTVKDRRDAHPRTLRRAVSFIESEAHRDITVADIAAAAHVTVRALQYAFRRHLGITPTEYLRRVRLDHAHRELLAADPTSGATVTEVAARWGFLHPGRFAHYYRRAYGRSPQRTHHDDG